MYTTLKCKPTPTMITRCTYIKYEFSALGVVSFVCNFLNRLHFASRTVVSLKLHNRQHPLAFALDLLSHNGDLG